jgi:Domain of unknown function (DUF4168)
MSDLQAAIGDALIVGKLPHPGIKKTPKIPNFAELMLNKIDQDKQDLGYVQVCGVAQLLPCPNLLLNASVEIKAMFAKSPCLPQFLSIVARRACMFGGLALISGTSAIAVSTIAVSTIALTPDRVMAQDADQEAILANDEIFTRYVRAAFAIEKQRQSMMAEVKTLTNGEVPTNNVCGNIDKFPAESQESVRAICQSYSKMVAAIAYQKYKLSKDEFNIFQRRVRTPEMRERIDAKIQALELK